jgi:hypothetical protein
MINLKNLSFEDFLQTVYKKFPDETKMILGSADASPESGPAKSNATSYSVDLIPGFKSEDTREFDRATLGLKAFFEILTQTNLEKWTIKKETVENITEWITPQIKTQADLDAWSYAILFNDLGKLHISNDHHEKIYGSHCADHDINMVDILKKDPGFYPGFEKLDKKYQESLVLGLGSGFNLGKAVQLECPASAWNPFLKISDFDQKFHLGHCLFDFIGVSGAGNPREYAPFVMNNETMSAFIDTIKHRDNHEYGMSRLQQAGLPENMDNAFPIARLVAMARIFTEDKKDKLMNAISLMPEDTREYLFKELAKPGTAKDPAIELQYAPAILNQVINGESEEVVSKTLSILTYLFKKARNNIHDNAEIHTFNLIDFASSMKANPVEAIATVEQSGMQAMGGGWKWTKDNTLDKENVIKNIQNNKLNHTPSKFLKM